MSRKLTAPMALLCALTLLFTGTASASDFFFPSVSALKGTPVPSYASLMRVQPVSEKFVGENLVQVYEKVSEDLYFAFGEALSASGCELLSSAVEGREMQISLRMEDVEYQIAYSLDEKRLTATYPADTRVEVLVNDEWLLMNPETEQQAESLYLRYGDAVRNQTVNIHAGRKAEAFLPLLKRFHCGDVTLWTDTFSATVTVDDKRTSYSLKDIENLTGLVTSQNIFSYSVPDTITYAELICDGSYSSLGVLTDKFPNLTALKISFRDAKTADVFSARRGSVIPETLKKMTFEAAGQSVLPASGQFRSFLSGAAARQPDLMINGKTASRYDFAENLSDEAKIDVEQGVSDRTCMDLYRRVLNDKKMDFSGGEPVFGNKLFVAVIQDTLQETSSAALAKGQEFYGLPAERLAGSCEEADTVVLIYRKKTQKGFYMPVGGTAWGVDTMIVVYDKASGAVTQPHSVCYNAPPSSKRGPGDGYGAFEADKAIAYITERY